MVAEILEGNFSKTTISSEERNTIGSPPEVIEFISPGTSVQEYLSLKAYDPCPLGIIKKKEEEKRKEKEEKCG